jgi:hypothetical protein
LGRHIGNRTDRIDDAYLASALRQLDPDALRDVLRRGLGRPDPGTEG